MINSIRNGTSSRLSAIGLPLLGLVATTAFAADAANEAPKWISNASLGFTLTDGNSDTVLATAKVTTGKKWDKNELSFGIEGVYGENEGDKNNEMIRGYGQYNRLFTERLYGYFRAEALHDAIADVEYRVTLSPGLGYYFIKAEKTTLSGEVGPGVVFEKQGSEESNYFTLRIAERFEHKLSERARIWQTLEYLPQVDDWDNYILNGEVGIAAAITKSLSLKAYVQDTYDNKPAPDREQNDIRLVTGVEYTF